MNRKKLILIISIAAVLVIALVCILIFKPFGGSTVKVYPVSSLAMYGMMDDSSEMFGSVRSEGVQKVYVSDTQTVGEVYVNTGQQVQIGDALLSYDTTLSEIELERAALDVKKLELEREEAVRQLAEINALVPSSEVLIEPDNSWIHYDPVSTPYFLTGTGTEEDPMYYIVDSSSLINTAFFESIFPEDASSLYLVLLQRKHNAVNGEIEEAFGLVIYKETSEEGEDVFSFKPFKAEIPEDIEKYDEPEEPYYEHLGSDYTAAEIAAMRSQTEASIRDLDLKIRLASLEYEKKTKEASDNVVRATRAGTVKTVRNPETAYKNGEPVIEISDGGGYYVDVEMSELDLDTLHPGDPVTVTSYIDGTVCDGTVSEISDVPSPSSGNYYSGNVNVSYYPLTVFVSEDAPLKEGDFVNISYSANADSSNSCYLESMYIRTDNGESYVYAADENGRLKKKPVRIGKNLYGYYTQVKEGLSDSDLIAFPYGKNVKEGAQTEQSTPEVLY